jgi:Flp pilus assembly protein TadG
MKATTRRIAALLSDESGSNVVEMAITSSVLLAMLLGICQISFALYVSQFTTDVARQATRYAMVRGSTSCLNTPNLPNCDATAAEVQTFAQSLDYAGIKTSNLTATTTWCAASTLQPSSTNATSWSSCSGATANSPGNLVQVIVTYPLSFTIPWVKTFSLNIASTSQMVIAQ